MLKWPGLLFLAAFFTTNIPGSEQYPLNVVFHPLTYQLIEPENAEPGLVYGLQQNVLSRSEDPSNQIICKTVQHGNAFIRDLSVANPQYLVYTTSPQEFEEKAALRYYLTVPSYGVSQDGSPSEVPEGAMAAPPPFVASLCVSSDSPRPFPVLFAPSSSSSYSYNNNDLRSELFRNTANPAFYQPSMLSPENQLFKVYVQIPSGSTVTLGLNGVAPSIERDFPFIEKDSLKHQNEPVTNIPSIDDVFRRKPDEKLQSTSNLVQTNDLSKNEPPALSLTFIKPVGSVGIGAPNSPAVNIEKQNVISSTPVVLKVEQAKNSLA